MSVTRLLTQALVVLRDCLRAQPGDEVLIVWDEIVSKDLVDALRYAAVAQGMRAYLLVYEPIGYRPLAEYGLFAGASRRPEGFPMPPGLAAALRSCEAIVLANADMEMLLYAPVLKEIRQAGARTLSLAYLTTEAAARVLPGSTEEVERLRAVTEAGGRLIGAAKRARVTTPAGTDITLSLGQYPPLLHTGVNEPGSFQILPGGQVTRIPDDGTANGTIVIDRSIAATNFKQLAEPVRFTVERGYVTKIEGGIEAQELRRWLEQQNDPEIYHVTELAYGTNPRCRLAGVAGPAEDTHTAGCVSFALGADVHLGGRTQAPAHVDMTMRVATLVLDDRVIVKNGALLV